jgi:hypothetical protein
MNAGPLQPRRTAVRSVIGLVLVAFVAASTRAATPPWETLGGPQLQGWTGIKPGDCAATLTVPGHAAFARPDGPRGFIKHGFRMENDGASDWTDFYGVRFDVRLTDDHPIELAVALDAAIANGPDRLVPAKVDVAGTGWHSVTLPWSAFAFPQAGTGFLRFGKGVQITADGPAETIGLRDVRVVRAATVALTADVRGKPADAGAAATYPLHLTNCTDRPQAVVVSPVLHGWETMTATVEPSSVQLPPGASADVTVRVAVGDRVPPGGHEPQVIQAVANGDAASAGVVSMVTTRSLPHPYIFHTVARWREVRDKVARYPWAGAAQDKLVATADRWEVPEVARAPNNDPNDTYGPNLFQTPQENNVLAAGFSWQLTHDRKYAEKVATFLRRLSSPVDGYPTTLRACSQSQVQEGHFFQHMAMAYDMIADAGVLSDADRDQIETTFRLLMGTIERLAENGSINNWNLSEDCGAFYCALALQDLSRADRFFAGPSGIRDQLAKGTMDDGWWYECSISYNMWCASEFTQVGLAYQPFGFNFTSDWVPASYSPDVMLASILSGGNGVESPQPWMKGKPFGMDPTLYGPTRRPYRTITDLWDSLLPFIDYRGVMFGVNDSTENKVAGNRSEVGGQPFEIAYYAFRDPRYAAIIQRGGGARDLLYGVPELPAHTPETFRDDAYADNVGLAMLRSQTVGRPIREQIQAVLHYGTHGWAHGHYDRTDLLSLMRYGRSFWNPENDWWGYEPFMYKFFVQTSVNHNMVVVDQKMQQATPGQRLLWHAGHAFQATAVQTTARWSNPPYGGMVYDYVPVKTFAEKADREGKYVPIPATQPAYGTLTDFTEPVLQRRLMVVTDDYVLLADHLKGTQPHTFDDLLQLKGFLGLDGGDKRFLRHDAQWNPDPVGSAQFVTDCDWYAVNAPSVARFAERFGPGSGELPGRSIGNDPGVLKLAVHTLWPPRQQVMVAAVPEDHDTGKRLAYAVRGDGKLLAQGQFGAWILGKGTVDVPLAGVQHLDLETRAEGSKRPTLFWAAARVVTKDGKQVPLNTLPVTYDNVLPTPATDRDYAGGPVKIAGEPYVDVLPAEPDDAAKPGVVRVDLSGLDAVRLTCVVGSDYPVGDESPRRKVYAVRSQGTDATFVTLIEPYEDQPMVKSASAVAPGTVRVQLADGRVQTIDIGHLDGDGTDLAVTLTETEANTVLRTESTAITTPTAP